MAVETGYPHIALDESGTPVIAGTTLKVIELVVEKLAYGWSRSTRRSSKASVGSRPCWWTRRRSGKISSAGWNT